MKEYSENLKGKRALSRQQLIDSGFTFKDYSNVIPGGEYIAILDMKSWGKSSCIHCYFTTDKEDKYVLTAYCKNEIYSPSNCNLDFSKMNINIGMKFILRIGKSKTGKTKWLYAEKID